MGKNQEKVEDGKKKRDGICVLLRGSQTDAETVFPSTKGYEYFQIKPRWKLGDSSAFLLQDITSPIKMSFGGESECVCFFVERMKALGMECG